MRWNVLALLGLASICLIGLLVQADAPAVQRSLLVVGIFFFAILAAALSAAGNGALPSSKPMIGFGVLLLLLAPLFSSWIYGDDIATVLRLEGPLRMARLLAHCGYSLILAGLLLRGWVAMRKPAPESAAVSDHREAANLEAADRSWLRESMRQYFFGLKVFLLVVIAFVIAVQVSLRLGLF
jgi:cytochrome b561